MLYADVVARYRDQITQSNTYQKVVDQHAKNEESVQALAKSINQLQVEVDRMRSSIRVPRKHVGRSGSLSSIGSATTRKTSNR
jgi:palmitoyltransferase